MEHARTKLIEKQLDLIVVNDVSKPGIGMGADENEVTVIDRDGEALEIGRASKAIVADAIVRVIAEHLP